MSLRRSLDTRLKTCLHVQAWGLLVEGRALAPVDHRTAVRIRQLARAERIKYEARRQGGPENADSSDRTQELDELRRTWVSGLAQDLGVDGQSLVDLVHDWQYDELIRLEIGGENVPGDLSKSLTLIAALSGLVRQDPGIEEVTLRTPGVDAMGEKLPPTELVRWALVPTTLREWYDSVFFPSSEFRRARRRFAQLGLRQISERFASVALSLGMEADALSKFLFRTELYWELSPLGPMTIAEESLVHKVAFAYEQTSIVPEALKGSMSDESVAHLLPTQISKRITSERIGYRSAYQLASNLRMTWAQFVRYLRALGVKQEINPLKLLFQPQFRAVIMANAIARELGFDDLEVMEIFRKAGFLPYIEDGVKTLRHLSDQNREFEVGYVVSGTVVAVGEHVAVNVGHTRNAYIPLAEWEDEGLPQLGTSVELLLESKKEVFNSIELVWSRKTAR